MVWLINYNVTHNSTIGQKDLYFGIWHIGNINLLRHNLDVMYIEKNFFNNIFNVVMNVKGKKKDNGKARKYIGPYCRQPDM